MNKDFKFKNKKIVVIILILAILIFSSSIFIGTKAKDLSDDQEYTFTVREGDNLNSVVNELYQHDLIRSKLSAKLVGKANDLSHIKTGNFILKRSMSPKELLATLNDPTQTISNEVMITFPEGMWAKDIADLLEQKTSVTQDELLKLWNDKNYLELLMDDYDFLSDEIINKDLKVALEGYLAPNTYNFFIDTDADQITRIFLDETQRIYQNNLDKIKKSSHTFHEILTLASITQFESGHPEDNALIAGVWENRIKEGMKFESSVTVCYALYEYDDWEECERQTDFKSPYNTYMNEGLPIGPVSNPGKAAIEATLQPKESDYLFFIADVYGDGKVYYAETFEEHLKNIDKYLR